MSWINRNIKDCKKATFLIEKGQHTSLTFTEQVKLKLHLSRCSWCRTYQKQSKNIQVIIKQVLPPKELDQQFKHDLQALISEKLKNK